MNQGYSTYEQIGINTSNPLKIILMMYDGCINFLNKAIDYAEAGDIKNKNIYANMARDIIVEFNNALNTEAGGEIAKGLRSLATDGPQDMTTPLGKTYRKRKIFPINIRSASIEALLNP